MFNIVITMFVAMGLHLTRAHSICISSFSPVVSLLVLSVFSVLFYISIFRLFSRAVERIELSSCLLAHAETQPSLALVARLISSPSLVLWLVQ